MEHRSTVIYNGSCPICSVEVSAYRRHALAHDLPLDFADLTRTDMAAFGLTPDLAARRLYLVQDGQMYSGIEAFLRLWAAMPKYRWLARIVGLPVVRPIARLVYDHVAAPLLYALHRRRQRSA
jgi:predicted DCC family thiol-disulfide oxidoreductase YuxK